MVKAIRVKIMKLSIVKAINRLVNGEVISLKLYKVTAPIIRIGTIKTGCIKKKADMLTAISQSITNCLLLMLNNYHNPKAESREK